MNVNYLTFKGKQYPIRVSYYALKQYQLETGKTVDTIDEDITNLETLLYYALKAGAKADNKSLDLDRSEMEMVLDESLDQFNAIMFGSFVPPEMKPEEEITFEEILGSAVGSIGMSPEDFWDLLPIEFFYIQKSYVEKEKIRSQTTWENTRLLAYYIYSSIPKKNRNASYQQFKSEHMPFEWDKKSDVKPLDDESLKKNIDFWKNIIYK